MVNSKGPFEAQQGSSKPTAPTPELVRKHRKTLLLWLIPLLIVSVIALVAVRVVAYQRRASLNAATDYLYDAQEHMDKGEYEQAVAEANKALDVYPDYSRAYAARGIAYFYLGKYEEAIADLSMGIEPERIDNQTDNAKTYSWRGFAFSELRQYERAIEDYNKSIELDPNECAYYNNRGYNYNALGQYEKALEDLDKAIELCPDEAKPYKNRGISYYSLGQNENAIADFEKALGIDPNLEEAKEYLRKMGERSRGTKSSAWHSTSFGITSPTSSWPPKTPMPRPRVWGR